MSPAALAFVFVVGIAAGLLIAALLVVRIQRPQPQATRAERRTEYRPPMRVFTDARRGL